MGTMDCQCNIELRIVVALTRNARGIGLLGKMPWKLKKDLQFFKELTLGNPVIMGRKTWESLPTASKPLKKRLNVVLTSNPTLFQKNYLETLTDEDRTEEEGLCLACNSLESALNMLRLRSFPVAYIIGGRQVFEEALVNPACSRVYLTRIYEDFACDTFFPCLPNYFQLVSNSEIFEENGIKFEFLEYRRDMYLTTGMNENSAHGKRQNINPSRPHEEYQYLELVRKIVEQGVFKNDRTGVGTLSLFGHQMRFSLQGQFPLLTTKKVFWRGVVHELLWFISGSTNAKKLSEKGIHIWDENASRAFLDNHGFLNREEGDLGPVYGFQWRHFGAKYRSMNDCYDNEGVDQLTDIIETLKRNPNDRRMILTAWNPSAIPEMALPPCHILAQFYVSNDNLSCHMYQRSCDMGLGVPFNIGSYALLTYMIAKLVHLSPGELIYSMGDVHIYQNHLGPLTFQLNRKPRPFPRLIIKDRPDLQKIDDFVFSDFELIDYHPHSVIKMPMAV
ncbi:thymidylate synthase/dihydrofolate reductase [Galdieria sulphuraria]|uniref:Bifunctional dihydrofolate reductase-thymidylate synthase n=1 Tax=Galdieria sulphuraria TaxID=130081 RepID=M2Y9L6_GALSU|nr:thymidylate synthase/dihydrofolate reductase [Galdieria sulphuraria]EME32569.1 thymidylate synthase/dihydrofolate reductase [Galdieria sulphuraria]|eukprot:XP_005709089.1 thymidylate synthase/dihydrofolate reductase [Galdieria sulphuraria]